MFKELFSYITQRAKITSDKVTAFEDAIKWIETYIKAEEYETAIMATRELMLKVKSGITYYTNAEKKVATLASSNIDEVSKKAKTKGKIIEKELQWLHQLETKLLKQIEKIETLKAKRDRINLEKKEEFEIEREINDINEYLKRKEYAQALHISKKLVSTYYNSKKSIDTLTRVQKLYDKNRHKDDILEKEEEKKSRYFREIGLKKENIIDPTQKKEKVSFNFFAELRVKLKKIREKQLEKTLYVKRQKTLRNIEKSLLKLWSVTKVSEENANIEIEEIMESGLTKEIGNFALDGFDFFGKIIGKDKIVGDTFWFFKNESKTFFYFWDATGHGVQAWFTVSLLTKIFGEQTKKIKDFGELMMVINNELKDKLKWRVFVTAVFFEHDSISGKLRYIGAGHDPMFFYSTKTKTVEKIIPGWLALGVRRITNVHSLKIREFDFVDDDILFGYTDGIIEARNMKSELFWIGKLMESFERSCKDSKGSILRIFQIMMDEIKEYMGWQVFMDDVSVFLFKRNSKLDVISNKDELDALLKEYDLNKRTIKLNLKGKTRDQIQEVIRQERKNKELDAILSNMLQLYKIGEYGRLKQAVTQAYKMGFVHEKMGYYLEKILKNEEKSKVLKHEDRLQKKYDMLSSMCDKGEYGIVIREAVDVLYKNGNI